ncbi:hypothetical protein HID58_053519 [Brassica napus]|uniref:Uncharacterized protein n=1 Tax=Brassica napus TaxID=3708 RepID=A0ABQ8AEX9_BRANA|nr:hypothetical protein HID58_053519 [Brassica napus]
MVMMGNLHGLRRSHHAGETPKATYPPSSSAPSGPQMTLDPYCHVDCSLRSLAGKAEGSGQAAVGGLNGPVCHNVIWIVFVVSGTINLSSFVNMSSHKTVDGRGQRVKITGVKAKQCENVSKGCRTRRRRYSNQTKIKQHLD